MRLSLRLKIVSLVLMTLTLGVVYGGVYLNSTIKRSQAATKIVENNIIFRSTSAVIHLVQVERGKTALYLNKSMEEKELTQQREFVDKGVAELAAIPSSIEVRDEKPLSDRLKSVRQMVASGEPTSQVIARYTDIIYSLLKQQVETSKKTSLDGIEMHLLGISSLELAKEYVGRTRANIAPLLAAQKPLTVRQISQIQDLYSHVLTYLNSPTLELSPEGTKNVANYLSGSQWKKVEAAITDVLDESSTGAFKKDSKEFYRDITQAINDLSEIVISELHSVSDESEAIRAQASRDMWFTIIVLSSAIVLTAGVSFLIIKGITKPIHKAVVSLNQASDSITLSTGQVTEASHQVSSATVESASALEEIVASVEELNSIVKQNTDRASQGAKLSTEGRQVAEEGQKELTSLIKAMEGIAASSRRIEEIINVIDDIAFQTNLLALNAAVEAARAGEQGKGFAVVADAVRALAQRSSTAAKDINSLIKESVSQVENGTQVADASEEALNSIVEAIKKIAILNEEIAAASQEQAQGIQQITKAMTELDTTTQANASVAEEVSASADQMTGQVVSIGQLVHTLREIVDGAA